MIRLKSDPTKCVTLKEGDDRTLDTFVLDACIKNPEYRGGGLFTY